MDLQTISTAIGATTAVFFLFLQPVKVQLQNLIDTMQEIKKFIENDRAELARMAQEIAVLNRENKSLWKRLESLERVVNERGCCHNAEQD